jgi:propanol-preferring alcohol dehydrogenase
VVVGLYGGSIPFGFGKVPHEARFMTSIWGTRAQLGELVALAQQHTVHATIEVIGLDDAQNAHDRLHAGDVSGRFVIVPGNGR